MIRAGTPESQGIVAGTIGTIGLGEGTPVATNGTAAGRQQNRRVELIVSGDVIGTRYDSSDAPVAPMGGWRIT